MTKLFAGRGDRSRASAPNFAHLGAVAPHAGFLGLGGGRRARAEEPTDEQKQKDEEDARKARRAEEDERREEEDARRAEEDRQRQEEDARRAEEEKEDGGEGKDKPPADGKTGKGAEDETDDDEECAEEQDDDAKVRKAARAGRLAERARWTRTMSHPSAAGRVPTACALLASSENRSDAITATLATLPVQTGRESLASKMVGVRDPAVGPDAPRRAGAKSPAASKAAEFVAAAHAADPTRVHKPG